MRQYFRILAYTLLMTGIALSSFAGIKKCSKALLKGGPFVSTIQAASSQADHNKTTRLETGCVPQSPSINTEEDDETGFAGRREKLISRKVAFSPQHYCCLPFAPPRVLTTPVQ